MSAGSAVCTTLEDYIKNFDKITDYTHGGKCSNCGACCGRLLTLSDREYKNIVKYIRDNNIQDQRCQLPMEALQDNRCPFRDEHNQKCVIYPVRPKICRLFICNQDIKTINRNRIMCAQRYDSYDMVKVLKEAYDDKI